MLNEVQQVVVIEMLTEDDKRKEMIIRNSRLDLLSTDELADSARQHAVAICQSDILLTNAGRHIIDLNNLYYRKTEDVPILQPNEAKAHQVERMKNKKVSA